MTEEADNIRGARALSLQAAALHAKLVEALRPMLGTPVLTTDGRLRAEVENLAPGNPAMRIVLGSGTVYLAWRVMAWEYADARTRVCLDTVVYLGRLHGDVLVSLTG